MDNPVILGLLFMCAILGLIGFVLGLYAVINVESFKRSTHKIEWREFDPSEIKKDKKSVGSLNADPLAPDDCEDEPFYDEDDGFAKALKELNEDRESVLL